MKQQWRDFVSMKWVINCELFQSHTKLRITDSEALDFPMRWSQVGNHRIADGVFAFIGSICRYFTVTGTKLMQLLLFPEGLVVELHSRSSVLFLWALNHCVTSDFKWNTKCILQSFKIAVGELPPLILYLPSLYLLSPSWIDYERITLEKYKKYTHLCFSLSPLGCWAHLETPGCSPQQACDKP